MKILVTGGSGFIGSHFIEEIINRDDVDKVYNVDCNTYASNKNLPFQDHPKYQKLTLDISAPYFPDQKTYLTSLNLDYVVHFAAESHVDNSIKSPKKFIDTNITGTFNLLEIFKDSDIKKFIHVSTDEVFGSLGNKEAGFNTDSPYRPNSPYAASKAASDLLVRSYIKTYKFPAVITNCSNNFGPRQFPEKMIPLCIQRLKSRQPIPLYGDGSNVRDWIYVKDHANAILEVTINGTIGKQYLIGGEFELSNLELITVLKTAYTHLTGVEVDWQWFKPVTDRKGHDLRYAIDTSEFRKEFPDFKLTPFTEAIYDTIGSYL